ncbi:MAG: hypothetical protein R3331_01525 [Sulfurospirillaceae bacterium]|nr:hypothetical protein [Sulfurospirillaceae bacterium]
MIKEITIDINEVAETLKKRNIQFTENGIFIMPEGYSESSDILNEYTPDIHKVLKQNQVNNIVVKRESYEYLSLRDATVILPLIIGIPFSILSSFIYDWIKNNFDTQSIIKLRFTKKKKDGKYVEIEIEGDKNEIKTILDSLKDF